MNQSIIEIYHTRGKRYNWRLIAGNGKKTAGGRGGKENGYKSPSAAKKAAIRARVEMNSAIIRGPKKKKS